MTDEASIRHWLDDHVWYQVWLDDSIFYVLILLASVDGNFAIYDPKLEKIIVEFDDLDEAQYWLAEDEYVSASPRRKDGDEFPPKD